MFGTVCMVAVRVLVNGSERAKVRPGVEVEVHPELTMYVESSKVGYWPNSVENQLIEVTDQTQHKLPAVNEPDIRVISLPAKTSFLVDADSCLTLSGRVR